MAVLDLDASPERVLRLMRGAVVDARRAYPDVLHLEVRDPEGGLWRFATQDAVWRPEDPNVLKGLRVEDVEVDEQTEELRLKLSHGVALCVQPTTLESEDDPSNWKLISPQGLVLEFGPSGRWNFDRADQPLHVASAGERSAVSGVNATELIESLRANIERATESLRVQQEAAALHSRDLDPDLLREFAAIRRVELTALIARWISLAGLAIAIAALLFALVR